MLFAGAATVLRRDALSVAGADEFYREAFNLVFLALLVALVVAAAGLLVAAVESVVDRRRQLAALAALGVPAATLRGASLLQSLAPTIPVVTVAVTAGAAAFPGTLGSQSWLTVGQLALLVITTSVLVTAVTAATLPTLHRALDTGELRYE